MKNNRDRLDCRETEAHDSEPKLKSKKNIMINHPPTESITWTASGGTIADWRYIYLAPNVYEILDDGVTIEHVGRLDGYS